LYDHDFWLLDFGIWLLDFGIWLLDFGIWLLDFGICLLDFGFVIPLSVLHHPELDSFCGTALNNGLDLVDGLSLAYLPTVAEAKAVSDGCSSTSHHQWLTTNY